MVYTDPVMVDLLITIDTELRPFLTLTLREAWQRISTTISGESLLTANMASDINSAHFTLQESRPYFFVEAPCSRVIGTDALARVIEPILADGHELVRVKDADWTKVW